MGFRNLCVNKKSIFYVDLSCLLAHHLSLSSSCRADTKWQQLIGLLRFSDHPRRIQLQQYLEIREIKVYLGENNQSLSDF